MTKPYTKQELIIIAVARQIEDGDNCLLGIGLPTLAGAIAKHNHAPGARLMMESGIIGFDPLLPPMHVADACCTEGYAYAVDLFSMFTAIAYRGFLDKAILGVAQIDRFGNLNSSYRISESGEEERITGAGGAPEFISYARETVLTLKSGEFVEELPYLSSPGYFGGGREREEKGYYPPGSGPSILITPDAMFKFSPDTREIYLHALAPGVSVEKVKAKIPWELKEAEQLAAFPVPTDEELTYLRLFSPKNSFSTAVAAELSVAATMKKFAKRQAFLDGCRQAK